MKLARRLFAWAAYVAFLAAVGAFVFIYVRNTPRCTFTGPLVRVHLSADGSRLVTLGPLKDHRNRGPLQVWDTHTGRVVHEWFADIEVQRYQASRDDRHGAVVLGDGRVRIIDWHTGQEWRFDEPPQDEPANRADFSHGGRWLMVVTARGDTLYLIDAAKREVVLRMKDNWPIISADDRLVFYRQYPDRNVTVWDIQQGKQLGMTGATANRFKLSADARLLLEQHHEPLPPRPDGGTGGLIRGNGVRRIEEKDYRVSVWDTATFERRFDHHLARAGNLEAWLSPDGRRLALWLRDASETSNLEMIDTDTGKLLWAYPMKLGENFAFAPDSSLCYFVRKLDDKNSILTMFDATTGRLLWEKPARGSTYFPMHAGLVLYQEEFAARQQILDVRTGAQRVTAPLNFTTSNYIPMMTRDGRHFVIGGWQSRNREAYFWEEWLDKRWPQLLGEDRDGALVMETATGRELCRVVGRCSDSYALSDDGKTLVTVDHPVEMPDRVFVFHVWDVLPVRAWRWAVAAVAVTMLVSFLASRLLRRYMLRR